MAWATPQFSRNQVDKAGKFITKSSQDITNRNDFVENANDFQRYLYIVNNWRSSHSYPLNTFQVTLRRRARQIDQNALVAQRIKRLESIQSKLARQTTQLSQMQDIGGCRAVLNSQEDVVNLVHIYLNASKSKRFAHQLKWQKDYISNPRSDGYRSYHLIYEYNGQNRYSIYDDLRIEIQIRSSVQHAWATAVESVGTFTKQSLKSNQGSVEWLRFFSLMGAMIAQREKTTPIPDTPAEQSKLKSELRQLANDLHAQQVLTAYKTALNYSNTVKDAKYFLLRLDLENRRVSIKRFTSLQSQEANTAYIEMETQNANNNLIQIVLVSVDSIAALKRAYPNYFLDTERFSELLKEFLA
jgi:ppGpp synthetase/RelA/SpoT-type nucleotidyltranferase